MPAKLSRFILTIFEKLLQTIDLYRYKKSLKKAIYGKRVLVVGSAPDTNFLKELPNDIIIFSCNKSPEKLLHAGFERPEITLYLCRRAATSESKYRKDLDKIYPKIKFVFFVTDKPKEIKKLFREALLVSKPIFIRDFSTGRLPDKTFATKLLPKLLGIKKNELQEIFGRSTKGTSAGSALIHMAEYFGARKIYLLGVGFDGDRKYQKAHQEADINVTLQLSKKFNNIYLLENKGRLASKLPLAGDFI